MASWERGWKTRQSYWGKGTFLRLGGWGRLLSHSTSPAERSICCSDLRLLATRRATRYWCPHTALAEASGAGVLPANLMCPLSKCAHTPSLAPRAPTPKRCPLGVAGAHGQPGEVSWAPEVCLHQCSLQRINSGLQEKAKCSL